MKTPKKLITNYSGMNNTELATLATRTLDALRDNANFPDLSPSFEEYEAVAQDYLTRHGISSKGGSIKENREKDEARDRLIVMMRRVASYINNLTSVSSVQLSSGFHPYSERKPGLAPRTPGWTRVRDSDRPGEILLQFPAIAEAYTYELAIASELDDSGEPLWQIIGEVSNSKGNFYAPVEDGVTYYFRVRCRNKHGISNWSPSSFIRARVYA